MMLKATIWTPVLSSFPPKTKLTKFSKTISNSLSLPPNVRQNALFTTIPPLPPPTSAYIHLPFCRKRCHYCDFPILALGSQSSQKDYTDPRISDYISLIIKEISSTISNPQNPPLKTIFFGGGTPSLVPPKLVASVLETVRKKFGLCEDAEISMEMDPGTFDEEKIKDFLGLGVNRVSLGVQAFQDELLNACGRAHGVKEIYEAIKIVKGNVENWSMDLISSLPHQTGEMWEESLSLAAEAEPTHVSVYDLQVEQGTKFGVLYTPGEFPLPSETKAAEFYKMASEMLSKAGYEHYEISSYCKSGYECKHNVTYWKNKPFYGFGLGSASYLDGKRFSRPKKLKEYTSYVHNLADKIVESDENNCIDMKDNAMDTVMLSLRTAKGLDLKMFREEFGSSVVHSLFKAYRPYIESGHVVCLGGNNRAITTEEFCSMLSDKEEREEIAAFIRLSDPDGFLLSNELISLAFRVIAP